MTNLAVSAPGTPIWVDLVSADIEATKRFYGAVFGWEAKEHPAEAGGYVTCLKNGKQVAGISPRMDPNQPAVWTTYLATENVDNTVSKARGAGATVLAEPFDVLDSGRMALVMDPTGAVFGLWQGKSMRGAELFNEPGAFCWNELSSRDLDRAIDFYRDVFGFGIKDEETPQGRYVQWEIEGRSVGGAMPTPEMVPAEVPAHWLTYFAVDNLEKTMAVVGDLGGQVVFGPMDTPQGPFATVSDPQGTMFAVIQMSGIG